MTKKEVLDALNSYKMCGIKIKAIEQDIKRLRQLAISSGSSIGDGMPHASGSSEARYTKIIDKLADVEISQKEELSRMLEKRKSVEELIGLVKNKRQKEILELRYIYGWSVFKIASQIDKSEQNVYAIQNRAINYICEATKKAGE